MTWFDLFNVLDILRSASTSTEESGDKGSAAKSDPDVLFICESIPRF